jgi:hypothetical protein
MIPQIITYNDLDGNTIQKEWHFALDRAEIAEMKIRHDGTGKGSLEDYLDLIVKEQDNNRLLDNFKAILFKSVGIRKGNYIDKSEEIRAEFIGSGAYEAMFMKMLEDAAYAAELINGIIPKDMAEQVAAKEAENNSRQYTDVELLAMSDDAFFAVAGGTNPMKWEPRFLLLAGKRKTAA